MAKSLTADELARLDRLFQRLTPEERGLLVVARDQIAEMPPEKQRALGREVSKFLDQRVRN